MSVMCGSAVVLMAGIACCAIGLTACTVDPDCGPRQATVERVIDGDTIIVTGGLVIRYLLVDAPETGGRAECYGANAARLNAELVLGKTVELTHDAACHDAYGRTLAYVTVADHDVNRLLIERGHACILHIPPSGDARAGELAALEAVARTLRRGLWGACDPIPCN
jgi:micrococcal nuclease